MKKSKKDPKGSSQAVRKKPAPPINTANLELGEIQKNNPIPGNGYLGRGPHINFPEQYAKIDSMEINDSITFPNTKEYVAMVNAIRTHIKKNGKKNFVMRKISKESQGIWRVELKRKRKGYGNRYMSAEEQAEKATTENA